MTEREIIGQELPELPYDDNYDDDFGEEYYGDNWPYFVDYGGEG